jgi:NitT/TauT family transport system ATP-binding protein
VSAPAASAPPTTPGGGVAAPPTALSFEGVRLTFPDGTDALEAIDLTIRRGEFVSLVGPSGCGKSTLLRLASGLLEPTAGKIVREDGEVGFVFQDATLLPWRTVADNVALLAELGGRPKRERQDLAARAISLVGLDAFAGHHPHALSGGMKMRVSLARAMALQPDLFLFDEPFGALDELTREQLNDELLGIFHSQRFTGVFVTHSIQEAVFLSTRVIVMSSRPGRLIDDIPVGFGYPRCPELRFDSDFVSICSGVSTALRAAH